MESELIHLFPTPLYCATLDFEKDEDFDQYIRQLEYARYPDDTGDVSVNKNILLEPEFAELKEEIDQINQVNIPDYNKELWSIGIGAVN